MCVGPALDHSFNVERSSTFGMFLFLRSRLPDWSRTSHTQKKKHNKNISRIPIFASDVEVTFPRGCTTVTVERLWGRFCPVAEQVFSAVILRSGRFFFSSFSQETSPNSSSRRDSELLRFTSPKSPSPPGRTPPNPRSVSRLLAASQRELFYFICRRRTEGAVAAAQSN